MDKRTRVAQDNCASIESTILEINKCCKKLQKALQEASVQLRDMNFVNHRHADEYRFRLDEFGKALNSELKTQTKVITDAKRDREFDLTVHSILGERDAIRAAAQHGNISRQDLEKRIRKFADLVYELMDQWPGWEHDQDHPDEEIRRYSWLIDCGSAFLEETFKVEEMHRISRNKQRNRQRKSSKKRNNRR